jgi:hypothetical protein
MENVELRVCVGVFGCLEEIWFLVDRTLLAVQTRNLNENHRLGAQTLGFLGLPNRT